MVSSDVKTAIAVALFVFGLGVALFDGGGIYPIVWGITMCWKSVQLL